MSNAYKILIGKPKRPVGRRGSRWEHNIRMDLWETGWKFVDWIHLVQERDQWHILMNTVMYLRVP